VTLPFRITERLAGILAECRIPGQRDICVVTHVEHPYEVTPELVTAVTRLVERGIDVYNQLVYTFYVSRRFEAASLRMLLRRVGIEPYYTFVPKGKDEMHAYRVPIARVMQEQKEEARLLPGTRRTDEPVYNLPGLGKNYIRAVQHRDLISIRPDGARVYEFHPWEKNVVQSKAYIGTDVPILEYLQRLESAGEDAREYQSIWYYY
jgi:lysine 2,3-aminomutase